MHAEKIMPHNVSAGLCGVSASAGKREEKAL